MSNVSLVLTFGLVCIAMGLSYKEKIGLEREMIIGSIRAVLQLAAIGFVLKYIFNLNNVWFTTVILLLMVYNAATVAAKRGTGIRNVLAIAFGAILIGLIITLGGLVIFNAISYTPSEAIPVSGMVVGNSMVAVGLAINQMRNSFQNKREEIEIKLSLGTIPREASSNIIRESIKTAMLPTVDSMKTLGIVQLPGMMTGMILAGIAPEVAIKYQIMVAFMLTGAVTITAYFASFWISNSFFNSLDQIENI
jgi:putative ABC transport system permease protein